MPFNREKPSAGAASARAAICHSQLEREKRGEEGPAWRGNREHTV